MTDTIRGPPNSLDPQPSKPTPGRGIEVAFTPTQKEYRMTRTIKVLMTAAILGAGSAAFAGPTDGTRQVVSPTMWSASTLEATTTKPYALTGSQGTTSTPGAWRRSVERFGNKVEADIYRR